MFLRSSVCFCSWPSETILDFGKVSVGQEHKQTLDLKNTAKTDPRHQTLRVYGICACLDQGKKAFQITVPPPQSLKPQETDHLKVVFRPWKVGRQEGRLRIVSSDPDPNGRVKILRLVGEGTD